MTPRQVDDLSLWEFAVMVDGYRRANAPEQTDTLTAAEIGRLSQLIDEDGG